jgi:muconolactone delta-isomerase
MEYLVTMTTRVPQGTPESAVEEVRRRESARARELTAEGRLLRLWRPPLRPGEWRTLGLFAAADDAQLEEVLASMPLRVWRTDETTMLSTHPNDPAPAEIGPSGQGGEFLVTLTVTVPDGTSARAVDEVWAHEAEHAHRLAHRGHLLRLWTLSPTRLGRSQTLSLWHARDAAQMDEILDSLPVHPWTNAQTTPLTPHPNDPAGIGR